MADRSKRRNSKHRLLDNDQEADGLVNPSMEEELVEYYQSFSQSQTEGETSAAEMLEENEKAEVLKSDLKTRHKRRKRDLSKLVSPKEDISSELKTVKLDSHKKIEETELETLNAGVTDTVTEQTTPLEETTVIQTQEILDELVARASALDQTKTQELEETLTTLDIPKEEDKEEEEQEKPVATDRKRSTIRERMKLRLAKAKEEEEEEFERQERVARKKSLKTKETRFEEGNLKEFDETKEAELQEKTEKMRKMRLERAKQLEALSFMPSPEQAFDFFTRVWEPEKEETDAEKKAETEAKETEKPEGEEAETEEERAAKEEEKGEESKLLADEDYTEEGYGPVAIRKAQLIDSVKVQKAEQEMLFYPSSAPTPAVEKVTGQSEPRFLEDEGFYVGVKPYVADRNKYKMENRLLKEAEKASQAGKWFGEDGQLVILPDPLRDTPTRPAVPEESVPYLETLFYKAILREFDSRYIDGAVDGGGFYQLDVDINSITFTHHHLFSREHVLANKLTSFYEEYLVRNKRNITEFLFEKLGALKNSAHLLQEYIASHKGEMSVTDRDNYERRLRDYKSEIRQTRFLRDREEQTDRTLLKNIIHTWKEIKALRDQQKFITTPVKLQIQKEETNKAEDLERWKFEIEEELQEEKEKFEEEYLRKQAVYKDQLEKYEKQAQAVEEAKKRIAERIQQRRGSKASKLSKISKNSQDTPRSDIFDDEEERIEEENRRDQEIIDEEPMAKPEPPDPFDENAVREIIRTKAMVQKRRPGEPKLYPELTHSATVSPPEQCSRGEMQRREDVSKCKLYVKILFNGKEVSRTGQRPLTQEFKVVFGQIYNLKIVEWPESIKYEIYETMGFGGGRLLTELYAPIPESSVTSQSVMLDNVEFSSYDKVQHQHEGVGSGVAFKFEGHVPDLVTLMTSGKLTSSVAWAVGEDGLPLVPTEKFGSGFQSAVQMKRLDPLAAIGASGVANMEKLLQWFKESRLDPNDPNNKDIVYMLSGGDQTLLQPREYFRLEPMQQEFNFASLEDLENNLRFKMIAFRDEEHPMFKGYQMIPLNDKELPREIFKEYEKKMREESQLPQAKGDLEQHRQQVNMYLQKIKNRVMTQYRFASHQRSLQDMVYEDKPPNYAMIFKALTRLSEPRRPLKPIRKERKKVTAQALHGQEVKILINIIRATFIPVRKSASRSLEFNSDLLFPSPGNTTARDTISKLVVDPYSAQVCPFVEVMFQRSRVRTRRGEGPNPSFNEKLELILKVPNDDYSPSALQGIEDMIYLNVFDEVTVDILEDNRERETNVHQRIEKKWLGSIKIPFSTVYFNNKIDGTFRLNTPPILLGYTFDQSQVQPATSVVDATRINTFLTMFITLEPSLTLPDPFKEKLSTNEEEELIQHAEVWQETLERKFPNRMFRTTVMDTSGRNVFVTRFFKPLKPPPEVEACQDPDKAMELAARYVSLIPFVADTALFPGQCDIWSTCNQFMKMLCGDEEEHAVLLTNYFLGMGKQAWLMLGNAIPEGRTAYVLTEDSSGHFFIWNARSGEKFSVYDNYCPIQVVGCVINEANIYANIQQYDKPSQLNFDFKNSKNWQSFYTKSFPSRGLASCQPNQLHYRRKDKKFEGLVMELQEKIEQLLKNKIMEWRSRYITRWNRHCTQIMRKLLPKLEENCGKPIAETELRDLEDSFKSYKVSGFPLNIPYTDMDNITETVFSTGVHAQETSEVEFALAVYVHGYTNNVMSIWIYVASLLRLR
ncbi:coiled-coil and C2 domain-containing protein 2A-like isoform X2 [Biomphalaria glabrata]|uniref:Coiled-coil and C2 domain-containing protein 2A-like isoform X2 n=1 Tax=Biomphalaria glabrata TaxID=6526 RepID=A0A9U8EBG5_BIOGL|nr:coiled-coil and C2 domain-containing protein 2A-like isoform X2 [Biomphalaria glabrata]